MNYEMNFERGEITLYDWRVEVLKHIYSQTTPTIYANLNRRDSVGIGKRVEYALQFIDVFVPGTMEATILKFKYFLDDETIIGIIGDKKEEKFRIYAVRQMNLKTRSFSKLLSLVLRTAKRRFERRYSDINRYIVSNDPDVFNLPRVEPADDVDDEYAELEIATRHNFRELYNIHPVTLINTTYGFGTATVIKINNKMLGIDQKYNWLRKYGYEHVVDFIHDAIMNTEYFGYTSNAILDYYASEYGSDDLDDFKREYVMELNELKNSSI